MSTKDIEDITNKYITDKYKAESLIKWAIDKSTKILYKKYY
ncbi:hypothetical protein BTW14_gp055 [BeAn 58058 virus]|nr:hypothetical protein BTW14_gp055 [BeAn 58058 virus]APG58246.1 hypothetical protein BAV00059 [BeAn 58058 virus]